MADPMVALLKFQQALNDGIAIIDPNELDEGYLKMYDELPSGKRYSYAKVVDREVQTVSIFGYEDPFRGVDRFSVGYAVKENHRGRRLSIEAVNKGIEDLKDKLRPTGKKSFYVEALVDKKNSPSIRIAQQLFPGTGVASVDSETGTPSLLFYKLIAI